VCLQLLCCLVPAATTALCFDLLNYFLCCLSRAGDDLDENFALSEEEDEHEDDSEEDGGTALDARRQAAAAGDHPLQKAFRQAAAKLAAKYGVEAAGAEGDDSEEDEGEESSGSEEGEGEEEESEGAEAAAAAGSEGEEEGEDEDASEEGSEGGSSSSEDEDEQQEAAAAAAGIKQQQNKQQQKQKQQEQQLEGPLDLSYTPPVPESYAEFAALVDGRPVEQLQLAVQRIRVFNAAALATDSKRKLQVSWFILLAEVCWSPCI
jgi:nucleolar protein 14